MLPNQFAFIANPKSVGQVLFCFANGIHTGWPLKIYYYQLSFRDIRLKVLINLPNQNSTNIGINISAPSLKAHTTQDCKIFRLVKVLLQNVYQIFHMAT